MSKYEFIGRYVMFLMDNGSSFDPYDLEHAYMLFQNKGCTFEEFIGEQ